MQPRQKHVTPFCCCTFFAHFSLRESTENEEPRRSVIFDLESATMAPSDITSWEKNHRLYTFRLVQLNLMFATTLRKVVSSANGVTDHKAGLNGI